MGAKRFSEMRLTTRVPQEVVWGTAKVPLGEVVVGITEDGEVCRVSFVRRHEAVTVVEQWQREWPGTDFEFGKVPKGWLTLPLLVIGTEFQKAVWEEIRRIPKGKALTYGEVALRVDAPRAARGVGTACKQCLLAYVIPCQRVVAANGIGGFGTEGRDFKEALLKAEGAKV